MGKGFLMLYDMNDRLQNDPEVLQAQDTWMSGYSEDSFQRYLDVRKKAEERIAAPSLYYWTAIVFGGAILAGLFMLMELIVFGFMLGKRSIQTGYRWYVTSVVTLIVSSLVAVGGMAGLIMTQTALRDSPEVSRATAELLAAQGDEVRQFNEKTSKVDLALQRLNNARKAAAARSQPWILFWSFFLAGAIILAVRALFGQALIFGVLLYKMWGQVQDGAARTTPGKALGFLFIPFFNFYWAFVVLPGLADELNRCAARRDLDISPASRGLMITYCILCIAAIIPYLGILAAFINIFIAVAALRSTSRVASALAGET
ncbi:MAG: hypothetical protein ACK4RK_15360 [Gemmataceae bacterium]